MAKSNQAQIDRVMRNGADKIAQNMSPTNSSTSNKAMSGIAFASLSAIVTALSGGGAILIPTILSVIGLLASNPELVTVPVSLVSDYLKGGDASRLTDIVLNVKKHGEFSDDFSTSNDRLKDSAYREALRQTSKDAYYFERKRLESFLDNDNDTGEAVSWSKEGVTPVVEQAEIDRTKQDSAKEYEAKKSQQEYLRNRDIVSNFQSPELPTIVGEHQQKLKDIDSEYRDVSGSVDEEEANRLQYNRALKARGYKRKN